MRIDEYDHDVQIVSQRKVLIIMSQIIQCYAYVVCSFYIKNMLTCTIKTFI